MIKKDQDSQLLTDNLLREFAKGDPMWTMGEISAEDQAILCMALPEICNELLSRRAAMKGTPIIQHLTPCNVVPFPGAWAPNRGRQ